MISIIMPYWRYNADSAKFLNLALDSVRCQTLPNSEYEVLLGLDCPTEAALREVYALIPRYEKPCNLKIFSRHGNAPGISATRNFIIPKAKGDWFAFLDADNVWTKNWLKVMLTKGKEIYPDIGYCKAKANIGIIREPPIPSFDKAHFEYYLKIPTAPLFGQVFLNKHHLDTVGKFEPRLRMWETSLMIVKLFYYFGFQSVPKANLFCREWVGSISDPTRTSTIKKQEWLETFRKIAREWWEEQERKTVS